MKKHMFLLIIFLISVSSVFAQEFYVDYQKIEGELTSKDLFRENFGRYDGFKMPMNKGERAHFIVYSNSFSPSLILVTPGDKKFQQASAKGEDFVTLGFKVPESGEWVLYVVGDSVSRGEYLLQTAFADSASLFLNENADFCTGMNYLLAHSNAYFIFPQTVPSSRSVYQIKGSIDSFVNGDDPSYNASFYQGNDKVKAGKKFIDLEKQIDACNLKGWKKKVEQDNNDESAIEKSITWTEQGKGSQRIVRLSYSDLTTSEEETEYLDKYSVDLVIMKY